MSLKPESMEEARLLQEEKAVTLKLVEEYQARLNAGPEGVVRPADVLREARSDVALHCCIGLWECGRLTWEQAMMQAAVIMAQRNRDLVRQLAREIARNPRPVMPQGGGQ